MPLLLLLELLWPIVVVVVALELGLQADEVSTSCLMCSTLTPSDIFEKLSWKNEGNLS